MMMVGAAIEDALTASQRADRERDRRHQPDERERAARASAPRAPCGRSCGRRRLGGARPWSLSFAAGPRSGAGRSSRREHGQHHDRAEGERAGPALHARERGELHDASTSSATTKMSSIDQRPMDSMQAIEPRALARQPAPRRAARESRSTSSASILASGTRMLATKTISARCQEPSSHRKTMPLMMVSSDEPKSELVSHHRQRVGRHVERPSPR